MPTIEEAIQQPQFENAQHRAQVNLLFTSSWLGQRTATALKPFGLSLQQFNVLRILRGCGNEPASVKLLTERMLDKMSNASRLVDRLEAKALVDRRACPSDRRRVDVVITKAGLDLLANASAAVEAIREATFGRLTPAEATTLSTLLDKVREE